MTESLDERFNRREKEIGDQYRDWYFREVALDRSQFSGPHAVPTLGHMLVANIEAVNRLMKETPRPYCSFAELAGMDVVQSDLVPKGKAYIVRKPELFPIQYEPIEFPREDMPFKFRMSQDFGVKLSVPRSIMYTTCDIADEAPRVNWPEPVVPAQPLSWWQWLVIVGVLSWVLCALSRAV